MERKKIISEPLQRKFSNSFLLTLLIMILATFLDTAFFFFIAAAIPYKALAIGSALFFHFLLSALLVALIFFYYTRSLDVRFLLIFVLFLGTLGPYGAVLVLSSLLLYALYFRLVDPLANLLANFFPESSLSASEIAYERIIYGLDEYRPRKIPIPFQDIMTFGSFLQKRIAVEKMLRYFHPDFTSALLTGLNDKSNAIRVQSATAISALDHDYFDKYTQLKKLSEKYPEDQKFLKDFAEHCKEYAYSEILDTDRAMKMRCSAIAAFEKYLEKKPHDLGTIESIGILHSLNNNYPASRKWLEKAASFPDCSEEAWLYYLRTLFYLNELESLQTIAKRKYQLLNPKKRKNFADGLIELWANGMDFEKF